MTQKAAIRKRILIPLCLALLFLISLGVGMTSRREEWSMQSRLQKKLLMVQDLFSLHLNEDKSLLSAHLDFLERDRNLQTAWLAKDRDALLAYASPIFETMKSQHNITHLYFMDLDKTCFLRVHNPKSFGDRIDRATMKQVVEEGREIYGVELGQYGMLTLRVIRPWKIDGKLAGYLETGEEITHFTPKMKEIFHTEIFVIIRKSYLDRDKWQKGLKLLGHTGDWEQFPDFIVTDHTRDEIPGELAAYLEDSKRFEDAQYFTPLIRSVDQGQHFLGGFLPLRDAAGRNLGKMAVFVDVTADKKALRDLTFFLISSGVSVSLLLFLFLYLYAGRIANSITAGERQLALEVEERKKAEEALRQSAVGLELRVRERTAELTAANARLEQEIAERRQAEEKIQKTLNDLRLFHDATIDRESRMIELKKEVNQLARELGKKEPYDLSFLG